ncbi:MAG: aldo/keto reductase, partial [Verrucomicrobiota bacterium]
MYRREFLHLLTASAASLSFASCADSPGDRWGAVLPKRKLGRTGELVTCLGLGGFHIGWTSESLAAATIEAALEEGVRFFDTAESYGPHISETRYGTYLVPKYRDEVFLMTKSGAKTGKDAQAHLDASLKRLKTDVIDLWQIHAIKNPDDVDSRLANGVLDMALKAKAQGKIRHIGFTGHASPDAHTQILKATGGDSEPFSACQFPVNPVDVSANGSFITQVLPEAQNRNLGLIAMKSLADGRFFAEKFVKGKQRWKTEDPIVPHQLTIQDCIHF